MDKSSNVKNPEPCPACQGSGMFAKGCQLFPCPECGGTGIMPPEEPESSPVPS